MRIARKRLRSGQCLRPSIAGIVLAKLLEAPARADGINVPLGKNGAEPGLQRTTSMEVPEKRPFRTFTAGQTVQLGKKGIREITGFRGTRFAAKNRGRRRAQIRAVGGEKMLPGVLASIGACGSQGQIFEMQRAEIVFELLRRHRSGCQGLLGAALERGGKSFARNPPPDSLRLGVEPLQERGLAVERHEEIHRRILNAAFWRVFRHLSTKREGQSPDKPDPTPGPPIAS